MATIRELAEKVGRLNEENSKKQFRASRFVKLALVVGGATVAAIASCVELAHANGEFSAWTIAGLAGAGLVAIGGVYVTITETDISEALELARQAVEQNRHLQEQIGDFEDECGHLNKEILRGLQLYNSMDVMRGAIEQSLDLDGISAATIIQTGLTGACGSLLDAFDFDSESVWTICIYVAQRAQESDKAQLRCVAHERKVPCDIALARVWAEGVGVAGVSYSMRNEVIIADMMDPEMSAVFNLKSNTRQYDDTRYCSIVSIPIFVGANAVPWGVAVATSDQPHHFYADSEEGVSTVEPIRAIAAMAALAVKAVESGDRASPPREPPNRQTSDKN